MRNGSCVCNILQLLTASFSAIRSEVSHHDVGWLAEVVVTDPLVAVNVI